MRLSVPVFTPSSLSQPSGAGGEDKDTEETNTKCKENNTDISVHHLQERHQEYHRVSKEIYSTREVVRLCLVDRLDQC